MKVGILITARLKSTRLPKKVLKKLGDKPLISHLIDRMRDVHLADSITIITSPISQDDDLEKFANQTQVNCYRGDPDDVLMRIKDAAILHKLDWVLSVTADNPWVCPIWADKLILESVKNNWDYGRIDGLPFGAFCYVLKKTAIDIACSIKNTNDTEVWGGYFSEEFGFKTGVLEVPLNSMVRKPEYRLTVDTPEDFKLAEVIYEQTLKNSSKKYSSLNDIVALLDNNKEIRNINKHIIQAIPKDIKIKLDSSKV